MFVRRQRRLRHQRSQAGIIGRIDEVLQLIVEHRQLIPQEPELLADGGELSLDRGT